MPFVEALESYSRALYLPLRGYVRRPFQFVSDVIREYVPGSLEDMRIVMEQTILGPSQYALERGGGGESPFASRGFFNRLTMKNTAVNTAVGTGTKTGGNHGASGSNVTGSTAAGNGGTKLLQNQPSMIQFFTSPYFLLLCFMNIVLNRINAIVAPRNPHPPRLSVRFALKLPALYLLMKSACVITALLIPELQHQTFLSSSSLLSKFAEVLSSLKAAYSEPHALWLCFIAMGVSCTIDSFITNLDSSNSRGSEHTTNMLEWAILFHFTPSGRDVLIIALIQVCQLLTLQFSSLSSRARNYRLVVTTFWGVVDLTHFAHAIYYRSSNYPSIQLLTRLPEVVVILVVCISMVVHTVTYIVTGGNVRRQMFESRALPSMADEYGVAVFKVGRACMEATRGVGFRNEVDAVVIPFGTILDHRNGHKHRSLQRDSSRARQNGGIYFSLPNGANGVRYGLSSGFANEMADIVETSSQRQRPSSLRNRINVMKAFCQSSASLLMETAYGIYNKIVPSRYRRTPRGSSSGTRMTIQNYLQLRSTIEQALEKARLSGEQKIHQFEREQYMLAAAMDEEEEEELYNDFLTRDFTATDDEDEDYDVNFMVFDDSEDGVGEEQESDFEGLENLDSNQESFEDPMSEQDRSGESESYGLKRSHTVDDDSDHEFVVDSDGNDGESEQHYSSAWRSLGSLQDFFLDTSFMSIFLSGRLQDTPLTRSQYRQAMSGAREFQQDSIEDIAGSSSSNSSGGGSGSGSLRLLRRRKGGMDDADKTTLLAVLNRYRKTVMEKSPLSSNTGSTVASSTSDNSSRDSINSTAPPPLAESLPSTAAEDSSIYSRLLCVVCQSEPRGVLLRPCRCLALCNECREILASRRFKQCPCCRADVQGFSKVYLP
ncbi:hypothetical protein BX616_007864 [Lobosporangium transversale]|uniref:RING-type domain-containing protein n=1 Tax=Lobosporangium transversale TaxID=64571 RepID=A0A1Y2GVF5_9FUNG|nr:hypothetical protein BCR41DRAFT_385608 [Lobosporangium transversale]KAF9918564.1 hypothetical protein BX616_007864 [Lobosporangium transversale]ORZ20029.1 hypothetical protein BCR41DRAFT_385608 [Lobosporangium transversale]|eukprot:XP_021882569.1 hypothetical protein BCR41DRAFT_385608 [Lobosporangium transversale]